MSGSSEENIRYPQFSTTSESGHRLSRFARCLAFGARLVRLPVSSSYMYQSKTAKRLPGNLPEKGCPDLFLISGRRQELPSIQMQNRNIHPERVLQFLHRAVWVSYVNVLAYIRPCEHRVKTIPSEVNNSFLFPSRKRLLFTSEHRYFRLKTPLAKPKHRGGLLCGTKAPDGAAFFPLVVPPWDVLFGC